MIKTFREFIKESYESHSILMHIDDHDYEQLSNVVHNHLSKFLPKEIRNKNYINNLFHIYNAGDRTPKEVFSYMLHTSEHENKKTRDSFHKDLYVAHNLSDSAVNSRARNKKATLLRAKPKLKLKSNKWYTL